MGKGTADHNDAMEMGALEDDLKPMPIASASNSVGVTIINNSCCTKGCCAIVCCIICCILILVAVFLGIGLGVNAHNE